jgi:hypothetical protein
LVFDIDRVLAKVQVKSSWFDKTKENFVVDNRRTKTNRRKMLRSSYNKFDFALAYIAQNDVLYVFPSRVFLSYGSEIHLVETSKRQRSPKSASNRDAWHLIQQWAASAEMPK